MMSGASGRRDPNAWMLDDVYRRRTAIAYLCALTLHAAGCVFWAAVFAAHALDVPTAVHPVIRHLDILTPLGAGFIAGWLVDRKLLVHAFILGVLMAAVSGALAWIALSFDVRVGVKDTAGAVLVAMMALLLTVPLSVAGATVGRLAGRSLQYALSVRTH